ncbi:acetyl-CoA C-acyltransferase [Parvibium lacunae]|uniref:Acetyl-CoA C-acyltransferase n=1 Tax=Parvibium lacunae TaxID=1888893 RepID=A0A368L4S8_9BURK|nr:acetyl-CoA C-acyltransferase [Parvibium lacunae]RCS58591.1 acetyl-CoA C-acyltransferase [Parvibium lacunae]
MLNEVWIAAAKRTPIGAFQGELARYRAPELAAQAIAGMISAAPPLTHSVQQVTLGCVLPAGLGQAPARQAALAAGLGQHVACTTINKMCGSGMQAVILAHDQIRAGSLNSALAGGMESMSQAPYLTPKARQGLRLGHSQLIDHLFFDGLEDAYARDEQGNRYLMGWFAEQCADEFGFTRAQQDHFAIRSTTRAQTATQSGWFAPEIIPLIPPGAGPETIATDEGPRRAKLDKVSQLRPAFRANGTITAANASSISDGAAALWLLSAAQARALGQVGLARIVAHATYAQAPEKFTTAPIGAIQAVLARAGWAAHEVDLYEINEAFAVVTMAAQTHFGLADEQVNVWGGACALGHPIGASGARILVTLIHALQQRGLKRGIASLCIGGGEATAIALELLPAA